MNFDMIKRIIMIAFIAVFVAACTESDDTGVNSSTDAFDRSMMLTNIADNIIIPAYQDLDTKLGELVTAKDNFIAQPNQPNLEIVRTAWFNAYKIWQHVEMFNIGKAEEIQYNFQMNIYPVNTTDVLNNVQSGIYDLTHPNNNDAVGFPVLDYMLHGIAENDAAIVAQYASANEASKYTAYLSDVTNQMKNLTATVLADWVSSYRATFISGTANTASSAANKLVNDFIFYFEKGLRANKIGIPAGNFSTERLPEKVEAFYNRESSKALAIEALTAVKNVFEGRAYNGTATGSSFKAYLEFLNKSDLAVHINTALTSAMQKLNVLDNSFYAQVTNDNTKMTEAYDALQVVVVLFKVDMLQAFNVSVDYVDADGD